jgi:hypothetical protein
VQSTQNFNQWQEELAEGLIDNFKADLIHAYTNRKQ